MTGRRSVAAVLLAIVCVASTGCAGMINRRNQMMASWVGRPSSELVTQWGAPTQAADIGAGQRVLTWREWSPIGKYWTSRTFTIDADGKIIGYNWRGL